MKRHAVALLIGVTIVLSLLMLIREDGTHACVVDFEYSRTMEFKRTQDRERHSRLREMSLRSLRALFEDWKFGSLAGEIPLYKMVRREFLALPGVEGRFSVERVDEILRATRFEIVDAQKGGLPIKGRIIVDTGADDVAESLARIYVRCVGKFVEEENESWAFKANLDKVNALQRLEDERDSLQMKLCAVRQDDPDNHRIKKLIAANQEAVRMAKEELNAAMKAYREEWDASFVFQNDDGE